MGAHQNWTKEETLLFLRSVKNVLTSAEVEGDEEVQFAEEQHFAALKWRNPKGRSPAAMKEKWLALKRVAVRACPVEAVGDEMEADKVILPCCSSIGLRISVMRS